ncbi:MAG: T9SS type A sorting domain-containing protein [Flavobacteriales bacterium]
MVHNHSVELGWPDAGFAVGHSVWPVDSGYWVFAGQLESDGRGKPFTVFFDTAGVFRSEQWFDLMPGQDFSLGYADPVETSFVPIRLGIVEFDDPGDSLNRLHLLAFGPDGDTVSCHVIYDSCWCAPKQSRPWGAGNIAMAGFVGFRGALFLVDSVGAVLDTTLYPNTASALCVDPLDQGGFVIAGYQGYAIDNNVWVMRVDSVGNTIWRRNIGGSYHAYVNVSAIQAQDGGIVATCSYMPIGGNWNDPQWNYFRKWNLNGNVQWTKQYNQAQGSTTYDLEELSDGHLVACGSDNSHYGLLIKLEPDGDMVWLRHYTYYNSNGAGHLPYDVEPTSDGGFALTGWAKQGISDSLPGLQMLWLLKVDSMGCLVPGCGNIGVEEIVLGLENALRVYPNPTNGHVTVEAALPNDLVVRGELRLVLVDALGRTVRNETLGRVFTTTTLDLSALPKGVYHVHLRDDGRWLSGTSVVVE